MQLFLCLFGLSEGIESSIHLDTVSDAQVPQNFLSTSIIFHTLAVVIFTAKCHICSKPKILIHDTKNQGTKGHSETQGHLNWR